VCGLADLHGLPYKRIGRHYGKNKILKVIGLGIRTLQLAPTIIEKKPFLALSHGSRSQLFLSWILNIPSVLITDYEHSTVLPLVHPNWLIIPEVVQVNGTQLKGDHILKYPGIKEDVYAPSLKPEPAILDYLGIDERELIITVRPPATEAHYHNPLSDELFASTIEWLADIADTRVVLLPRSELQESFIRGKWPELIAKGKVLIPDKVVDGLNLVWFSDLVISGGGTMNREAAALGVPVYSIFRGKIGAVDKYLSENGRLTLLENPEDLRRKVILEKRLRPAAPKHDDRPALAQIVENVVKILEGC
jgi:predicted glycosyltransferase